MNNQKDMTTDSGRRVYGEPAVYTPSDNPMYRFNPYIEALHPTLTAEKASSLMRRYPAYSEKMRTWTPIQRCHQVQEIAHFVQPLPELIDLEARFSRMIRNGYLARNPLPPMKLMQLHSAFPNLDFDRGGATYFPQFHSNSAGFNMLGPSGSGKTTAWNSVLSTYTQVIEHTVYNDMPFDRKQLAWLKLECPANGSTKSLCMDFFRSVDNLLGTRYSEVVSSRRYSQEDLLQTMPAVAECQGLGVLVVDEIQRLNVAHSGGAMNMLQFFVELSNKIGVPVVLVGTCKALQIFQSDFALARRSSGQGDMVWMNMAQDDTWDFFVESLWQYQLTTKSTPLTPALKRALYLESHGIIDIVVKLYMLAQWEVIGEADETITPKVIHTVAREKLKIVRPLLQAAKSRNLEDMVDLDYALPNKKVLEQSMQMARSRIALGNTLDILRKQNLFNQNLPEEVAGNLAEVAFADESEGYDRKTAKSCARSALENHGNEPDTKLAVRDAFRMAEKLSPNADNPSKNRDSSGDSKNFFIHNHATVPSDLRQIIKKAGKRTSPYEALKNASVISESGEHM